MQLDKPFLPLVLVLNLLDLAVSHRRFCGEENVLCVPTDMSKVFSTIGFRRATSSRVGEVTVLVCAPYATFYKLVRQLGPRPFDWTPCIVPHRVLKFSVEQGCLSCSQNRDLIASGIRFADQGGCSGPECEKAGNLPGPVSLVGLLKKNESSKVSRQI